MISKRFRTVALLASSLSVALLATVFAPPSRAVPITFAGSGDDNNQGSGTNLSATVTFDLSGTSLTVTLKNTTLNSAGGAYHNADVLTAVYWNSTNTLGASPVSAALGVGSSLIETGGADRAGPLGGNWQYATGNGTYAGAPINQGISSSGLDIFGSGNFGGTSRMLDGSAWGIISTSDTVPADGVLNTSPFVRDTVVFNLTVAPGTTLNDIDYVVFQYGTSSSEPSHLGLPIPPAPEPATVTLFALGTIGIVMLRLRRARRIGR